MKKLLLEAATDLNYFKMLVSSPKADDLPLLEAAIAIGKVQYPDMDIQEALTIIDALARRLAQRCVDAGTEIKRLREMSYFFYKEMGFAGNVNDFYTPDNSCIHQVLETRRGIPITLAVIYAELARTIGLDVVGVSFPGHFMLKVNLHEGAVVLDPLTGYSFTKEDLYERIDGDNKGVSNDSLERHLKAASPQETLMRMLRNLREIYQQQGDADKKQAVVDRMVIIQAAQIQNIQ